MKAEMHQLLEKKGTAESGVKEQKTQPKEIGFSSVSQGGKYHSLIQNQAQELTHLRQKMRIGRAVSSLLIQHVKNTIKTFEELLSSNSIDHYMEQHFCEQLARGSQLAESLASKFSTDDCTSKKSEAGQVLQILCILRKMHKMGQNEVPETTQDSKSQTQLQIFSSSHAQSAIHGPSNSTTSSMFEEQEVHPAMDAANASPAVPADSATLPSNRSGARSAQPSCPLSGTTPHHTTPPNRQHGSSGPWDKMRPQKTNASGNLCTFSSLYQPNSKPSGADLLEKNLADIQSLRQRLEKSVCISDCLQEREHVLSNADQGKHRYCPVSPRCESLLATPHSYAQSHSSGSDQEFL
uniref:Olduvai domain-containing protein n=1 Tax=Loxodonta africana TaxID=9785 RepID=G3TXE7_LOXAF